MKPSTKKLLLWGVGLAIGAKLLSVVVRRAGIQQQSGMSGFLMPAPSPYMPKYYNLGQRSVIHSTPQSGRNPTAL